DKQPISLIILAPTGDGAIAGAQDKIACGVVFTRGVSSASPDGSVPPRFDIFVWMRRAYRGLVIASRCAKKVLNDFRGMPRDQHNARDYTLEARYPAWPREMAERRRGEMEHVVWLSFFSHYDFRCPRGQQPIQGGYWVIERTFRPEDTEP